MMDIDELQAGVLGDKNQMPMEVLSENNELKAVLSCNGALQEEVLNDDDELQAEILHGNEKLQAVLLCDNNELQTEVLSDNNNVQTRAISDNDEMQDEVLEGNVKVQAEVLDDNDELQAEMLAGNNELQAEVLADNDELQVEVSVGNDESQVEVLADNNELQAEVQADNGEFQAQVKAMVFGDHDKLQAEVKPAVLGENDELQAVVCQPEIKMVVPVSVEEKSESSRIVSKMHSMMESNVDFVEFPRKKKMFSSSSFYEEPNAIYPTMEEQVKLCRQIADSLSDDCNKKSRGTNMFFKRVKNAEKWIHESSIMFEKEIQTSTESNSTSTDPSMLPYVRVSKGPPKLKLMLDPRHIVDMKRLRQEGVNIVEHNAVSPEICHDLVKDLNSPTGKGAQLFAKRKKKSEDWVVDEEKVKALLRERRNEGCYSPEPELPIKPLTHPRVAMIKTPWNAAMESPIGSCEGAFKEVHTNEIAESVIKAAEAKVMFYPSPIVPVIEPGIQNESPAVSAPQQSLRPAFPKAPTTTMPVAAFRADVYKSRTPKGWTSGSTTSSYCATESRSLTSEVLQPISVSPTPSKSTLAMNTSTSRTFSFTNFNATPKAWSSESSSTQSQTYIKPVKPPSLLVQ